MIYKYRDRDFTGIDGYMFAYKGISEKSTPFYVRDLSGQTNTLSIVKNNSRALTLTIEKSIDGKNWTVLGTTSTAALTVTIPAYQKLYLRCSTSFWALMDTQGLQYNHILVSNHCSIGGNIMSLLYGAQFTGNETIFPSGHQQGGEVFRSLFDNCDTIIRASALILPVIELTEDHCYANMFYGCTSLTTAPALPASTLADSCYAGMFAGCASLTTAPALPATTLAQQCYSVMFEGCTSLTAAPTLPATTLSYGCYDYMFYGCTSLTTAPALPATTLATYCYQSMFKGCTSLTAAPELPATTLADSCYKNMFAGCASLTTAPALPATTSAQYCYANMFSGCTSLVAAPELPATTLTIWCYSGMFSGCTNLNYIKCLATDISASACTYWWMDGVNASGTFYKKAGVTWPTGSDGIPSGWTVVEV